MKKYLFIFLMVILALNANMLYSDTWMEDFDTGTIGSYATGDVTLATGTWTASNAGNFSYGNTTMGSKCFTINDDKADASITTPSLNTLGTVSFKYAYKSGTDSNVFVLQKSTDGINFTDLDTHTLGAASNLSYVDYSYAVNDPSTSLYIRVLSDDQNAHLFIEDFSVTENGTGGTTPTELTADFSADQVSGTFPLTVNFTNLTAGGTSPYAFEWDFDNDGTVDSTDENPTYIFTSAADYSVSLYVIDNELGEDTELKTDYISVTTPIGTGYYAGITATEGDALKIQLNALIDDNTNSDYDDARAQMYAISDNHDNTVSCVYTGASYASTYGTTSAPGDINCEHSYPQSWIDDYVAIAERTTAKADVHHLFPTSSGVNSARGNLAFDNVNSVLNSYSEVTGYTSYRGYNADGETVFEPADQHKGNVARAMFYMNVRYDAPISYTDADHSNVDMIPTLIAWNNADPVDALEIGRNDANEIFQNNRNPFVDHSEWIDSIWGAGAVPVCAMPTITPNPGTYDAVQNVTLSTTTDGATIYYTTDGTTPDATSTSYSTTIAVAADMTIKAIAMKADCTSSIVVTGSYIIDIIPTVSIYDIQYTTSDASSYVGQTVNVTGIVSAVKSNGFNISTLTGGEWNGILVYTSDATPSLGDNVTFNGEVSEYNNLTELVSINSYSVLSSGNTVTPTVITTAQLDSEESYEGVLVTILDVTCTEIPGTDGKWTAENTSGAANLDNSFFDILPIPSVGLIYSSITGVVEDSYTGFYLNPRSSEDAVVDASANQVPIVSNVASAPSTVYPTNEITVTADAIDNDGTLTVVNLKWGTTTETYTTTTAMTFSRASYSAVIPAQAEGTTIYYVVEATDDGLDTTTSDEALITVYPEPAEGAATDLFISEYIEPDGGNNKVIEIFNGTGNPVDLSAYTIGKIGNGGEWVESTLALSGTLANNDVFIIANGGSTPEVLAVTDLTDGSLFTFNGDDAMGLLKNGVLIDAVGTDGPDPGAGWDVAGVTNATANHTLVRKSNVSSPTTDWATSSGTTVEDSQWIVEDANTISYLGSHVFAGGGEVLETVVTPVITPETGLFETSQEVTIACATLDAIIYYTLDESAPSDASTLYSAPFSVTETTTVKAIAVKADMNNSGIATATYTETVIVELPNVMISEIMYNPGSALGNDDVYEYLELYNAEPTQVDLSDYYIATAVDYTFATGTTIDAGEYIVIAVDSASYEGNGYDVYQFAGALTNSSEAIELYASNGQLVDTVTYDDGDPWPSAADGSGPSLELISTDLDNSLATSWQAITNNGTPGAATAIPLPTVETPAITPNGGDFNAIQAVTITSATTDAVIYYTIDGSYPTDASTLYTVAFDITETTTVKAIAMKADYNNSEVVTADFTDISVPAIVANPVISPETGTFFETQSVSITCETDAASIYYTLDGTEPTDASTLYTVAFDVAATTTVKAIAMKTDWTNSSVVESIITIEELVIPVGVIISEYIEGSSNNKAVEIFNGTGSEIDLTHYSVQKGSNGGDWASTCDMIGTLAAGDVFVIANSSANAAILAESDTTNTITYFNGNDAVGLFYSNVLIDIIGLTDGLSTSNFDVAGVTGAAANHTLVRKMSVTEGTTDWAVSAGTSAEDSQWVVYDSDTFSFIGSHSDLAEVAETPVILPNGGNFETAVDVTITSTTDGASIYYTTDGTDPTDASTLYTAPFSFSTAGTVKAIAMKASFINSQIASADFTFDTVVEVATIAELRAGALNSTIYRLTGEALVTFTRSTRNQKYIQDSTAGILIDDNSGFMTTVYNQYDGITGLVGTLNDYNGVLQLIPTADAGVATSNNNIVTPTVVTINELNTNFEAYESKLIRVTDVTFVEAGNFAASQNYTLNDGTNNLVFRTGFSEADYLTTAISANSLNVTGLAIEFNGTAQMTSRNIADMEELTSEYDDGPNVSKTSMTFESEVGVIADVQSYVLYNQGVEIVNVVVTGDFEIKDPDSGLWDTEFTSEAIDEELTVEVRFNATNAGVVNGTISHIADEDDGTEVLLTLTGTGNVVLPTSIYDIQYTTVADDGTYPSLYANQDVLVEGIVSDNTYSGEYVITSPAGGAWNGIYVNDANNEPEVGDFVSFRANVYEAYGFTQLKTVTEFTTVSSDNNTPAPIVVTTADLASNEAYEGVLVTIENVTVSSSPSSYGEWHVTDGSGDCQVDDAMYIPTPDPEIGANYSSITGIVDYAFDNFGLNPRNEADIVTTPTVTDLDSPVVSISVSGSTITLSWEAIENAASYKIYMSETPVIDTNVDATYNVAGITLDIPASDMMKFYQVIATTDEISASK